MLPKRKPTMFPTSRDDLAYVEKVVTMATKDAGEAWSELVRQFEDERNYLSICVFRRPGEADQTVQVEVGVHDERQRHATAGLVARWWPHGGGRIAGLDVVLVDGKACQITEFVEVLADHVALPASQGETVFGEVA